MPSEHGPEADEPEVMAALAERASEQLPRERESMLAEELRALGRTAGDGFSGVVERVHQTHRAVAARAFGAVGGIAAPVKLVHDAVAGVAYESTRVVGRGAFRIGGEVGARVLPDQLPGAERRLRARVLKGALNGLYGDRLAAEDSHLAIDMTAHVRGVPRGRMAVFVHGLCETEDAWFLHEQRCPNYGSRLRQELGYTPVYVRYNSGLEVETNGLRLALLLEQLATFWPAELSEITLIGHSMGGLVARAACAQGEGTRWGPLLRHLIMLGTPHRGAPLEQTVAVASRVLSWVPETRPVSDLLDARSAGIKDLRRRTSTPYLTDVGHHFYSAGIGRGGEAVETVLGDLLVPRLSAWDSARGESVRFAGEHYRHLHGATHFDLLGHPVVSDQLVKWLAVAELAAPD